MKYNCIIKYILGNVAIHRIISSIPYIHLELSDILYVWQMLSVLRFFKY